jgi:TonB-dependent SusC/RagA subfamily outer membrane receptor
MPGFTRSTLCPGIMLVGLLAACARSSGPETDPQPQSGGVSDPSHATVSSGDSGTNPGDPIDKLLMSRSPGVWVGRTSDGAISIRIRGAGSLTGSNEPLYVVDGVPLQPGADGGLSGVNPYDIESIKVLKDATDLTMYGSRGANGVILIKTKRPPKPNPDPGQ